MNSTSEKTLLKKLGEETIYSAKGHFKACDLRRQLVTYTIWTCAILGIVGIIGTTPIVDKVISSVGLLGTIALLLWNEGDGKNYRANHKLIAERYLSIHKDIRALYFLDNADSSTIAAVNTRLTLLDQSEKPDIPGYARKLAKKSIESSDPETDNWFR